MKTSKRDKQEQEWREEAQRLLALPPADRRTVIELHHSIATNRRVHPSVRRLSKAWADALQRYLGLPEAGS
jgi:hypothetical protein